MVNFLADLSWFVFFASTLPYASHQATYLQYSHFVMQATTGLASLLAFVIMRHDVTINCRRHNKQSCLLSKSLSYEKDCGNTAPSAAPAPPIATGPTAAEQEAVEQTKRNGGGDHLYAFRQTEGFVRQKMHLTAIQHSSSDDKATKKEPGSKEGRNDNRSMTRHSRSSGQNRKGTSGQPLDEVASGNQSYASSYLLAGGPVGLSVDGHRATDVRTTSNREVTSDEMLVHTSV